MWSVLPVRHLLARCQPRFLARQIWTFGGVRGLFWTNRGDLLSLWDDYAWSLLPSLTTISTVRGAKRQARGGQSRRRAMISPAIQSRLLLEGELCRYQKADTHIGMTIQPEASFASGSQSAIRGNKRSKVITTMPWNSDSKRRSNGGRVIIHSR